MASKLSFQWDKFSPAVNKQFEKIPSWLFYVSLSGMCVFIIIAGAIIRNQSDILSVIDNSELSVDFVWSFYKSNIWCMVCLGLFLLCASILAVCFFSSFFIGLIAVISFRDGHQSKPYQDVAKVTPKTLFSQNKEISMDNKIITLKLLIIDCFWDPSFWGGGTNYSINFKIDLEELILKDKNKMKLGHLAYILRENRWNKDTSLDFKSWLYAFFDALDIERPSETSPSKYSDKNESMATGFGEVDKKFKYLFNREKTEATTRKK